MFPYKDDNPTYLRPVVTLLLIAVNALVWVFVQGMGAEPAITSSICELGLIPGELLGTAPVGMGIEMGPHAVCVIGDAPVWHTAISSMFLHGGWFHLLGNLWFLWIFGNNVEDSMGHGRCLVFYVVTGLAAAAAQVAVNLVFLGLFFFRTARPALLILGYWFLLQVLGGRPTLGTETGGVAFWAHAGGFVAGLLLIFLFRDPALIARRRRRPARGWMP